MFHLEWHIEHRFRRMTIFAAMSGALCHQRVIGIHGGNNSGGLSALRRSQNFISPFIRRLPFSMVVRFNLLALIRSLLFSDSEICLKAFHQFLKSWLLLMGKKGIWMEALYYHNCPVAIAIDCGHYSLNG